MYRVVFVVLLILATVCNPAVANDEIEGFFFGVENSEDAGHGSIKAGMFAGKRDSKLFNPEIALSLGLIYDSETKETSEEFLLLTGDVEGRLLFGNLPVKPFIGAGIKLGSDFGSDDEGNDDKDNDNDGFVDEDDEDEGFAEGWLNVEAGISIEIEKLYFVVSAKRPILTSSEYEMIYSVQVGFLY